MKDGQQYVPAPANVAQYVPAPANVPQDVPAPANVPQDVPAPANVPQDVPAQADVPRRNWALTVDYELSRHRLHPESSPEMKREVWQQVDQQTPAYLFFQVLNFRHPDGTVYIL
jgi:hypothetical protein